MKAKVLLTVLLFSSFLVYSQRVEYQPDSTFKKRVIKMEFFSPLTGNLTLGYEQYLKNFTSIEAKIGIIGIGKQPEYDAQGVFVKVGPKFKLKPNYATDGTFGTHLLRGAYIRPELVFSAFETNNSRATERKEGVTAGAILINYGKQYVLGDIMTLDWHMGVGYGFSSNEDQGYYFGYVAGTNDFPVAVSVGMTLGFLLK